MPIELKQLKDALGAQQLVDASNTSLVSTAIGVLGKYTGVGTADQLTALNSMWMSYRAALFPELNQAGVNTFDNSGGATNFLDSYNKKDILVGYQFKSALRDFFYSWLPSKGIGNTNLTTLVTNYFTQFLNDGTASLAGKRQNFAGMWVILLLIKILQSMQDTAPNKASAALLFSQGEEAAARKGAAVTFFQQQCTNDFSSQKKNQDAQKKAESYRNWRTLTGQKTSSYQTQTQTSNDSYSQMQQLISSILEQFQGMLREITK